MNWEENQHDRNQTNLECGAKISSKAVKPPQNWPDRLCRDSYLVCYKRKYDTFVFKFSRLVISKS